MHQRACFILAFPLLLLITAACGGKSAARAGASVEVDGIVVDDRDEQMELDGVWQEVEVDGAYGDGCVWAPPNPTVPNDFGYTAYASSLSAYAYVRPDLPQPGTYEVFARWCAPPPGELTGRSISTVSEIQVHPKRGRVAYTPVQANMARVTEQWRSLGRFYMERDGFLIVNNLEGPNNGAVVVDAFQFVFRTSERLEPPASGPPVPPPQPSPTP